MTRALPVLGALLLLGAAPRADAVEPVSPEPGVATFVVVVGTTRPDRPGLATLRYSDDDAARWYELTSLFARNVELLSVLDPDTQARHAGLAEIARVPTRAALSAALERTRERIAAAKAKGLRTAFWFVFAGHGDVGDNREGYLVLQDGRFTRRDLYEDVLARSNADVNHVILDACRAWFMVSRRGAAPAAAIRELLDDQSLSRFPNTGVLLATTESAEVHEWDRYQAGVFSHEARSALLGGADVNGDGRITYLEVAAFITAANTKVSDPRGKLSIAALPPASNLGAALVDWSAVENASRLVIREESGEGISVEDDRGVRLADVHPAAAQTVSLVLPPARSFIARGKGWEAKFAPEAGGSVRLDSLSRKTPGLASRGITDAFERGLFAVPFGAAFYEGFAAANPRGLFPRAPSMPRRSWTWRTPAAWSTASASLASGAFALVELDRSRAAATRYRNAFGSEERVHALRERAESGQRNAWIAGGVSALSAGASAWFFWNEHRSVGFAAAVHEDGASARVSWRFGRLPEGRTEAP